MKKSETKKWLGLFLALAVAVTTVLSPAPFLYAAGDEGGSTGNTAPTAVSGDVGQYATASSSGETGDRNVNTINDVNWIPQGPQGSEGQNVPQRFGWGNWGMPVTEDGYHYVQYDWNGAVTTSKMELYWWDDGSDQNGVNIGGLGAPGTLKILYKDANVSGDDPLVWKEATMTTNYSDAQKVGEYNVIEFEEISAVSIRLAMTVSNTDTNKRNGEGICRWKIAGTLNPLSEEQTYKVDQDRLKLLSWTETDFELPATTSSGKALVWESNDTSVIKVEGNTAKVTQGSKEKTVKLTAKLNGKLFKEFPVIVAKRELLQGATVSLPIQGASWWGCEGLVIDGNYDNFANGNNETQGRDVIQLNFARKLTLTGTKVYWHIIDGYAPLPTGVTFQYLKNEVSPDDAASWEDIELEGTPAFTAETGDLYTFKDTVNTTKLRMKITEGTFDGESDKKTASIKEWEVSGEEYIDPTDMIAANAVKEKIEDLGTPEYTSAFKAKLDEARTMYDALTPTQQGLLEDIYKTLTDAEDAYGNLEAADAVIKAIDAILTGNVTADGKLNVTEANKEQIQAKADAARAAYDKLNETQQKLVTNYGTLTNAEAVLKDFGRSDEEILADLVVEINAIGSADDMTVANMEEYKAKIESAEGRRDALKDQTLVTGATGETKAALDKLTALRTKYNTLNTNKSAAQPVIDAINVIGNLTDTEECYERYQTAKTKFTALTDDQKALVSNKATLDAAETYFTGKTIVTELTITEPASKTLKVGDKLKLTAATTPAGAAVTWTSNKPDTVKVSETTGDIEALKAGSATITATAGNNNKTATITFTVETPAVEVTELTITPASKTMTVGDKLTLKATTTPANQKVTWKLTSGDAVKVSETTGEVEALKAGKATITATAGSNNKTATCEITVTDKGVEVTALTLSDGSKELKIDEEFDLTATTTPADQKVTWESSDDTVISMTETENGKVKVKALKEGTATITATAGKLTKECKITVKDEGGEPGEPTVSEVTLNAKDFALYVGGSKTLKATVKFSDGTTNNKVTWKSDKTGVAAVKNGKVTAKKKGTAKITATSVDDPTKSVTVKVTVKEVALKTITLPMKKLTLGNGDSITLKPTFKPANATNKGVNWAVDKKGKKVVTVKNGKITANKKKTGTAKVTVTSKSNKKAKATITITVKKQPKSIKLGKIKGMKKNTVTLKVKKTCQIKVTMTPKSAGSLLTYKTNNKKVATVDANGKVTAKKKGTAKITVTTGNKKKVVLTVKVK